MSTNSKALLKKAKNLFIEKNFAITIKLCKKVLKEDKQNYNALVLMGAAMREVEDLKSQVPDILMKAANIQPDNPVAWYGLAFFYEAQLENDEIVADLLTIYNKLLKFEGNTTKFITYLDNMKKCLVAMPNDNALSECMTILCERKSREDTDVNLVSTINEKIISILTEYPKVTNEFNEILEEVLSVLIQNENSTNRKNYYKKYLKLLYKSEKIDKLISEAEKMYSIFNQDIYPLEWVCRAYSEFVITHGTYKNVNILLYSWILLDHDSESILGYFAKAVQLYEIGNLVEARNILSHLVHIKPKWFHAWLLLGKIDISLYCWEDAETAALLAEKLIPEGDPHNLRRVINLMQLEALIKSSSKLKWKKAESKIDELSDGSAKSLILRARLCVLLQDPHAKEMIHDMKNDDDMKVDATMLHAMYLLQERHLEEAADVLGSILETSEAWLTLGKIHWEMADYGHSLMAFLKGVSADPNNWECLLYLGKYHQLQTKDYERSRKCYQKALQINPNSDEAGIGLSSAHRHLKNNEENLRFLTQLTNHGRGPKWALLRLGLQHLDQGNISEAVTVLQNAVKTDPTDNNCWECLADAYLARGAYLSAIKSYERASELNPESIYSMTQLANIKLLVGEIAVAKEDFLKIVEHNENNIIALKGLTECYFKLGKNYAKAQLLARARENFQFALDNAVKAIKQKSEFLCIWKLLGDICYNVAVMPDKYRYLSVNPELLQSDSKDNISIAKEDVFLLSSRCYCRALSLSKNSPLLWHDLSRCYLAQLHLNDSIDKNEIAQKSLAAAKEAVKTNPNNWIHWNLLGVICMSNEIKHYALAQHSFAMAIEIECNNAISWTNLGSLYLFLDDVYRANEAFSWAQKIDPAYINCWIGQALIAEKVSPKDAMDLFRHAIKLGYHHQAAVGYTHWVIKTIMDPESKKDPLYTYVIENMHAITVATDGVQWYTVHFPNDPYALNAHGLLLERQELYRPAAKQFSIALKYAKDSKQKDLLSINLARVLVQQELYEEAVKHCLSINEPSFISHCQLAISLFKAEHYKESYEAYNAAVEWLADSDTDKAHVLCAMASMAYMFQESNDAKTLLFQAVAIQPPIISGYLTLAALGMLDGDKNLTNLVLKELKNHDGNSEYRNHIVKLIAYSYLTQNDKEGASKVLRQYIHCYPDSSELWTYLAKILLTISDYSFNKCVDKALLLSEDVSSEHIAKMSCMSSLSKLITLNPNGGLRSVLNTVHSYPGSIDSWSNLITALMPRWAKISQQNAHWLMVLASRVRNNLPCTRSMEQWLLKNEKHANDIAYH